MAREQQQDMDRRRAIGLIGQGSAAAVMVGAGVLSAATHDAVRVDLARVRHEFDAGVDAVPLDRLLPDGADEAHLEAARASLRFRTRGIARVLLDRNRSTKDQLMDAKQAMLTAQSTLDEVVDRLVARSISAAQARGTARATLASYIEVMRTLG